MKYIASFLITLFIFTSCVTTNVIEISIRQPATITFPPEVANIVIVDNSPVTAAAETTAEESIITTDSAKTILLKSLHQFMSEENYFSKVDLYPYKMNSNDSEETVTPLSKRKIQSICNERDADALISLDLFAVSALMESDKIGYFSNYNILSTKLGTILNVYSESGEEYAKPVVYVDSLFRAEEVNWSQMKKNIPQINDMVTEISVLAADKLTSAFIPSWKTDTRWYYSDNSSEMKQAARYVQEGKWAEAADIWGTLFDKADKTSKKVRLASNLALANECLDDIPNAISWIQVARSLFPEEKGSELSLQISAYYVLLAVRANNIPKLNRQLGIIQ